MSRILREERQAEGFRFEIGRNNVLGLQSSGSRSYPIMSDSIMLPLSKNSSPGSHLFYVQALATVG